jgi:hypothetical protein
MLEVKPGNTNHLRWLPARTWYWRSLVYILRSVNRSVTSHSRNNLRLSVPRHEQLRSSAWKKSSPPPPHFQVCWPSYRLCQQNPCCCCNFQCITVMAHFPSRPHNDLMAGTWRILARTHTSCFVFPTQSAGASFHLTQIPFLQLQYLWPKVYCHAVSNGTAGVYFSAV